ncbi:hypothetical protein OSTOST_15826 [Ostertagia ostertagi]
MVAERAVALWKRKEYEQYKSGLGFAASATCILSSLILTAWSMRKLDSTALAVYCSSSTNETAEGITTLCFILCGINTISLIGIALLCVYNVAAMKRNFSDLQSSYQLRENASVLRLILPLVAFNGFCQASMSATAGVFLIFRAHFSFVAYRTIFAAAYTVPYFTVVSPILLWLVIKKSQQTRVTELRLLGKRQHNEKDLYFKVYSRMWNR